MEAEERPDYSTPCSNPAVIRLKRNGHGFGAATGKFCKGAAMLRI